MEKINNQLEIMVFLFGNHYGTNLYHLGTPMVDIPAILEMVEDGEYSPWEVDEIVRGRKIVEKYKTKNFPKNDVWEHSTFLGKFVDVHGKNWDLGIYLREEGDPRGWSAACVYGNDGGHYISGNHTMYERNNPDFIDEMIKRAREAKLIN